MSSAGVPADSAMITGTRSSPPQAATGEYVLLRDPEQEVQVVLGIVEKDNRPAARGDQAGVSLTGPRP